MVFWSDGLWLALSAELRFRRAFQSAMDAKRRAIPDVVMEETEATLFAEPWWRAYLPLALRD